MNYKDSHRLLFSLKSALRKTLFLDHKLVEPVDEVSWVDICLNDITDAVMIDVGAHFGESLNSFSNRGWQIVAFEPDDTNGKISAITNKLNSKSLLFTCALSNVESSSNAFYVSNISTGISGLLPFHDSHIPSTIVNVRTLKSVIRELRLTNINFLKIDTEGNDLLVLQGLDWSLIPDIILCEFEDSKTQYANYNYKDLGNYLLSGGYNVFLSEWYPIRRYGIQHSWRRLCSYPCSLKDKNAWGNFIAVKPSLTNSFLNAIRSFGIKLQKC